MRHAKKYCIVLLLLSGFGVVWSADSDPEARPEGQPAPIAQQPNNRPVFLAPNRQHEDERRCCNARNQERLFVAATGWALGYVMHPLIDFFFPPQQ